MSHYYPEELAKEMWFYISTHFFGAKYVAGRCNITSTALRDRVFSWDGKYESVEHALICAGCDLEESVAEELYIAPISEAGRGSYRHCKQRQSAQGIIKFLSDVSCGGDVNYGDFLSLEELNGRLFILSHQQFSNTHIIEVDQSWVGYDKLAETLNKQLCNFQGQSVLSPLSLKLLESIVAQFDSAEECNDYYRALDNMHSWANHFEYHHKYIQKMLKENTTFFWNTPFYDGTL